MTNDLTTISGSLQQAIDDLETNLALMGVDATFDSATGLMGLVDEILNIEASIGGLELVTSISCECDEYVGVNEQFSIVGVLQADKDDTSQVNVDLEGYLKGATVKIYNGNTLLGTTITGNKGQYSFNYTHNISGALSIKAVFEGTDDYNSCNSGYVSVNIGDVSLNANKNILNYSANDILVLSAEYTGSNEVDISFYNNNELLGTERTVNGIATYSYESEGIGDMEVYAKIQDMSSNTIHIEDLLYYNDGSSTTGLEIGIGVSCISDGEWINISTPTSGEKFVFPPRPINCFTGSENWEISFQFNPNNFESQAFGLQMEYCDSGTYAGNSAYTSWSGAFNNCMGYGSKTVDGMSANSIVTFRRLNGNWILLVDGVQQLTRSMSWNDKWVPGFYTNNGRMQHLKNIKIKKL